jgi:hypothetical protein
LPRRDARLIAIQIYLKSSNLLGIYFKYFQ